MRIEINTNQGEITGFSCDTESELLVSYFNDLFYDITIRDAVIDWIKLNYSGQITILKNLYINPESRGQKVGSSLLTQFIGQSVGSIILVCDNLEIQQDGFNLLNWYLSKGFKETGFGTLSGPILVR